MRIENVSFKNEIDNKWYLNCNVQIVAEKEINKIFDLFIAEVEYIVNDEYFEYLYIYNVDGILKGYYKNEFELIHNDTFFVDYYDYYDFI